LISHVFSGSIDKAISFSFPVNNLENGVYFISARLGSVVKSFKVVVLR
jgi:hypothetical protein